MQAVCPRFATFLPGAILARSAPAENCAWSRVDHRVSYDASGIWNTNVHRRIVYGAWACAAAPVTPCVLGYGRDYPGTYALLLLSLYVGIGRIKNRQHWQTDVLAEWTVGALAGWHAHSRDVPILIEILPRGFAIGFKRQF